MKRVLTIQDLSCVGKCSLTAALPVLSVMGMEVCALPTAILSTHTMFPHPHVRDLSEDMLRIAAHWQAQGIAFDCLQTGYLASERQAELTMELLRTFRGENTFTVVDPAMGDGGRLYSGFAPAFPAKMAALCALADAVTPNLTEAALLLGRPYPGEDCGEQTAEAFAKALTERGPACAMITGVTFSDGRIGAVGWDRRAGKAFRAASERIGGKFHATGDLFTAAFTGGCLRGLPAAQAAQIAADFVSQSLKNTPKERKDALGPCFETALPWLAQELEARLARQE